MKIGAVGYSYFKTKNLPFNKMANTGVVDKKIFLNGSLPLYQVPFLGNFVNSDKKGFDSLIGYEEEKEYVNKKFIEPIINKKSLENVPNGIILYGPTGGGKTTFANALCEQLEKENIRVVKPFRIDLHTKEQEEEINKAFKKAQERYKKTGEYTVIYLNTHIAHMPNILNNLYNSEEKGAIWIGETDENIRDIDKSLLTPDANTLKVPLSYMNNKDAEKYLKHLLKTAPVKDNFDYKYVVDSLNDNKIMLTPTSYKYWSQDFIIDSKYRNKTITEDDYIGYMSQRYYDMPGYKKCFENFQQDKEYTEEIDKEHTFSGFIKINENYQNAISELATLIKSLSENVNKSDVKNPTENNENLSKIISDEPIDFNLLKKEILNNESLLNFWIMLSDGSEKIEGYTPRLKELKLNEILEDDKKAQEYAKYTLEIINRTKSTISTTKESLKDILDNDPSVTPSEKNILKRYQNSEEFLELIADNSNIGIQRNTISALKQLSKEEKEAKDNAKRNIFMPALNSEILNKDDEKSKEIVNYILSLVAQSASNSTEEKRKKISGILKQFDDAKINCQKQGFNEAWTKIVNIAQDYFDTEIVNDLTQRNIHLLSSINKNMEYEDKTITNAVNDVTVTKIEQKEFILRHKNDIVFKEMLKSIDYNLGQEIDNLLYYEASANNIALSMLSQKFSGEELIEKFTIWQKTDLQEGLRQRYSEVKNRKYNIIVDKLDDIKDSIKVQGSLVVKTINEQTDVIKEFANNVALMQSAQLSELIKANEQLNTISQNTAEIKQYTQVIARKQLLELQKDKYYKDIIPELTKLLPKDEQEDLGDFLLRVDDLVKNEKDSTKKKKIIKAAAIVAGVVATAALVYFAGPAVVEYLGSGLTAQMSTSIATATVGQADIAKMVGNSGMLSKINFHGYINKKAAEMTLSKSSGGAASDLLKATKEGKFDGISDFSSDAFRREALKIPGVTSSLIDTVQNKH